MAGRFVRASKYRHVFGKPTRKESCYDNLRISRNAWDTNLVKANPKYLAVNWEASGGGAFAVLPLKEKGRLPEQIPLFRGHTAPVLDTDWNPFNDNLIASGSDDGRVFVWQVPQEFTLYSDAEEPADIAPSGKFSGHSRKVGQVLFNPAAENTLASASSDLTIVIWDISSEKPHLKLKHNEIVQSLSWSANGSMLATTSRDKRLRIWDVRQERPAHDVPGHSGAKNSRVVWMGEHNRLATTGFSKMSDRQIALWDIGNPAEPVNGFTHLDSISGVCMPFWDDGTQCLYLGGKGDGNIRYFEYENDKFEFLSEYKSSEPQRGLAFIPRRGINVHENEIMRAYKTVNDSYIEPISFTVPRRAEVFQSDIYPPAIGLKPAMSVIEWLGGKNGIPAKIDLQSIYEGNTPVEIASDYKTPAHVTTTPPAKPPTPKMAESKPVIQKSTSFISDSKESLISIANKYQDDTRSSSASKPSGLWEASKPEQVANQSSAKKEINSSSVMIPPSKTVQINLETAPQATIKKKSSHVKLNNNSHSTNESSSNDNSLKTSLDHITNLLEIQTERINSQCQELGRLAHEVDTLKSKVGTGSQEQNERIRQLELELQAVRSETL